MEAIFEKFYVNEGAVFLKLHIQSWHKKSGKSKVIIMNARELLNIFEKIQVIWHWNKGNANQLRTIFKQAVRVHLWCWMIPMWGNWEGALSYSYIWSIKSIPCLVLSYTPE